MFKVIIAGSRDFKDYEFLKTKVLKALKSKIPNVEIVSGAAKGADSLGEDLAIEQRFALKTFPARWKEIEGKPKSEIKKDSSGNPYWTKAGYVRNRDMAEYADALIAFWDGKSPGTKNMIQKAKDKQLPTKVYIYE